MIEKKNDIKPALNRSSYLGMTTQDLDKLWYAKYWNPNMAPLPAHITEALVNGPQAAALLPPISQVVTLAETGYQIFENGFGVSEEGAAVVAALTKMPGVTPAMWDWWFAWHGSDSRRYKLWNPSAHLYAAWKDGLIEPPGKTDREGYINRTTFVDEYVGSTKLALAIHFVPPTTLGFDANVIADPQQATVICGRVGLSEVPIDSGYLVHYIRKTSDGSEMRSRFWLGGNYIEARDAGKIPSENIQRNDTQMIWQAYSLLVHCAKEMNHLASFLPMLYEDFQRGKSRS